MISHTTERFRRALRALPEPVRRQARQAYERFREGDDITWFWIGSHAEYDALVARLRRT